MKGNKKHLLTALITSISLFLKNLAQKSNLNQIDFQRNAGLTLKSI